MLVLTSKSSRFRSVVFITAVMFRTSEATNNGDWRKHNGGRDKKKRERKREIDASVRWR
jgi:hypothetical protein